VVKREKIEVSLVLLQKVIANNLQVRNIRAILFFVRGPFCASLM
jgi:hypothetical protein